jgi:hypothetical protein
MALLVALSAVLGCGRGTSTTFTVSRETLPNGALLVRYESLPEPAGPPVEPDLRIGASEDDLKAIFGDVRGIEVDAAGMIYVLDYQAGEIRAFDPRGNYLRTVVSKGRGPGEIEQANGMVLVEDTVLWIKEHSKWQMMKMSTTGRVLDAFPIDDLRHGFVWTGTVDDAGKFWKPWEKPRTAPTQTRREGVTAGAADVYFVSHDRATNSRDTLYVGPATFKTFSIRTEGGGGLHRSIPFSARLVSRIDPAGGFWKAETQSYRVVRHDARGDSVVVVDVAVEPRSVTAADRRKYVENSTRRPPQIPDRVPNMLESAEIIAALMPETKPVIADLAVDDGGRVWVRRNVPDGADPRYDIFDRGGEYVGSIVTGFDPALRLPVHIRADRMYALALDSLGVPVVVRTPHLGLP